MCASYNDFLVRLKEEREGKQLSQNDMSRYARISQSKYSKAEHGQRRFHYRELEGMCESDVDLHYIFTASRGSGKYLEFFSECNYQELLFFLEYLSSYITYRHRTSYDLLWKQLYERVKYVPFLERGIGSSNLFVRLRQSVGHSQMKMAEELGLDVKKLRDLENGRSQPDSELFFNMYDKFEIPPSVILRDSKGVARELEILLELMEASEQEKLFELLERMHEE